MKRLLLVIISILIASFSFGQFTFGPQIGWNTSKISTNLKNDYSNFVTAAAKSGLTGGVFFRFGKKTYIQPEIFVSTKGGIFKYEGNDASSSTSQLQAQKVKLITIDVPLLVGRKLIKIPKFSLRVFLGPVVSFYSDAKINNIISGSDSDLITKGNFNQTLWGGQIGTGIDLLFLTLDFKYELGFSKFDNTTKLNRANEKLFFITLGMKII